jgi:hypothetical protein
VTVPVGEHQRCSRRRHPAAKLDDYFHTGCHRSQPSVVGASRLVKKKLRTLSMQASDVGARSPRSWATSAHVISNRRRACALVLWPMSDYRRDMGGDDNEALDEEAWKEMCK